MGFTRPQEQAENKWPGYSYQRESDYRHWQRTTLEGWKDREANKAAIADYERNLNWLRGTGFKK